MGSVPCESGQKPQRVPETLQGTPRPPCVGIDFSSVRQGLLSAPFLPVPVHPPSAGASCSAAGVHLFPPLPSARPAGPWRAAGILPLTCRLPHALLLCLQFGSGFPSLLLTPGHSSLGSLATPGISSLAQGLAPATGPPAPGLPEGGALALPQLSPIPPPPHPDFPASCRDSLSPGLCCHQQWQ